MTSENDTNDPRVSEVYRQFAGEESPARLDDKILAMAAREARTRYGLMRAWMRPVAWAATIGLSLAFLLEITQLDDAAKPIADVAQPAADVAQPAVAPETARSESDRVTPEPTARPARNDADLLKVKDQADSRHGIAKRTNAAQELASDDMSMLDEAEERARMQSNDAPAAAASFAVAAEKKELSGHCGEPARATAQAWFACIEQLREDGRTSDAEQELEALLSRFPDFKAPTAE